MIYGFLEAVKMETTVLEEGEGLCKELPCSHGLGHGSNPPTPVLVQGTEKDTYVLYVVCSR
jgi:hypothetical protein